MSRSIVFVACVAVGAALAVAWLVHRPNGSPFFEGKLSHDFGTHTLLGPYVDLTHTFTLRNTSAETLYVEGVSTSCGCTEAELSSEIVPPGETLSVTATMRLATPRRRVEQVTLRLGDAGMQSLQLVGTARRAHDVFSNRTAVLLSPGGTHGDRLAGWRSRPRTEGAGERAFVAIGPGWIVLLVAKWWLAIVLLHVALGPRGRGAIERVADAAGLRDVMLARVRGSRTAGLGDEAPAPAAIDGGWTSEHVGVLREIRDLV